MLIACDSRSWGGLEREVIWLAATWHERGHQVTLCVPRGSRLALEAGHHGLAVLTHGYRAPLRMLDLWTLGRWILKHKPDLVHAHDSGSLRSLSIVLSLCGSPSLLYLTRHMGLKHTRRNVLNRLVYRKIRCVYAISSYVAQGIHDHLPVPSERVRILPPGIRHQHFATHPVSSREAKNRLALTPELPVVGMLGRITPMKGHPEFLMAMHILQKQGRSIQGVIAGGASSDRREQHFLREIKSLRQELGLAEVVHLTGESQDPRSAFAAMDIFVFPSYLESFGMTVVEAMTFGLPVIACAAGGVLDIIVDGQTGILIPPRDPVALATAITRLLDSPDLSKRLVQGAQSATEIWDIHRIAARYESDFYEDLRNSPGNNCSRPT